MSGVRFTFDGIELVSEPDETIWQAAKRAGTIIPHLCHRDEPGYRPDGNCRACMVEIEGERVLAASCIRKPSHGMVVKSASPRAEKARRMVFDLLAKKAGAAALRIDPESVFLHWNKEVGSPAFSHGEKPMRPDCSHPAIAVNLDACIACGLCARACREVQVNDVIGMAYRGVQTEPVFDLADPLGQSTCVACGECVQACPTGALYERSLMNADATRHAIKPERFVDTTCPWCGVGCQTRVGVAGDRIVQVDGRNGPANENRLCVKGRFGFDHVHHPHRLRKPLIRRADAPKRGDDVIDPGNPFTHFREATWEEALARAAEGFRAIRDRHGSAALAGFGSAKGTNEEAYLFQKLVRQGFGTNNVDHCTRLCHASSVAALMEGIGSAAVTAPFTAAADADCIVVIGARPTENHPVAATYLKQAAKRGASLIVMDPRRHELMRHATHAIQFRAGMDLALLKAMLNVIITEGLIDRQYIAARVEGFAELEKNVRDFTPEAMAPLCGVEAETIRSIARTYARAERSIIFWGMGISQHAHGTDNARCLIALALITGHVGRPGTGLHPLRGQNNVQGASDAGLIPMVFPDYRSVENGDVRAEFEKLWGTALDPRRGLTVVEIMHAILAGSIKAMLIMGENPAMSDPDQAHARAALAKLDHLVVQDIFLTETAWHADVVLPASSHAEKWGTYTNTNRQVQIGRPVLPLPGEARRDIDILVALARRLGLDWDYGQAGDGTVDVSRVYAEMASVMPSLANISWERLNREEAVTYPAPAPDKPGKDILFGEGFPTIDGRGRVVTAALTPPLENPDADYPLILTTGRLLEHWHTGSMTRRAGVLAELEPEAICAMHPREIARRGLRAGALVTVETRRGAVTATLRADPDVAEGMVFMPFCFVEAPANLLTNPQLDPIGKIPEFKVAAARVGAA